MEKVDIKTLAKRLNLSISTISRALRDSHEISNQTIDKVKALAKKLNYQPNPYASTLKQRSTNTIGIVVPEVANNFFAQVFDGIDTEAQTNKYHSLIYLTHDNYEKEKSIINHLQNGRVDGVIMSKASDTKNDEHISTLIKAGIPVIFFDRVGEKINTVKVVTNDYESAFVATEHLIKQGAKKILHLTTSLHLSTTKKRKDGFIAACKKNGLPVKNSWVLVCDNMYKTEENLIKKLKQVNRPDGIFSAVEKLSLVSYKICNQLQINIPRDLKLVSFSNSEAVDYLVPSLTTITQPAFEIGKAAAKALFERLDKKKRVVKNGEEFVTLPSKLVERGSTK